MICATSELSPYRVRFSDGEHEGFSDATADKGGAHAGFRPHDLIEAALASCTNIMVRMCADSHAIPLRSVTTRVSADRSHPEEVVFRYEVTLYGDVSPEQRLQLMRAAEACPVRRTLSKRLKFEQTGADTAEKPPV